MSSVQYQLSGEVVIDFLSYPEGTLFCLLEEAIKQQLMPPLKAGFGNRLKKNGYLFMKEFLVFAHTVKT